jgi:hypothetical protein
MRVLHICVAFGLATMAGLGGCKSNGAAKEDMQLVPKEAEVVVNANFNRMRNTAMWRKMLDLRDSEPTKKKEFDEFVQKCGLDPFKQIDSAFMGFPHGMSESKEFAVILRGTFNEQKLVECTREQAKKDGADLAISEYAGKKLYTDTRQGQAFATFLDAKTVAIGGKEWIKKIVDLAGKKDSGGQAMADNAELVALTKRVKTSDAIWGAGVVPQSARDNMKSDPQLASAASMKTVFGSVDFAAGFAADVNVDLGSEQDAKDMTVKTQAQLADAKKNPQVMMMGVSALLDQVKIDSKAATFHVSVSFNQMQVDDIIKRVQGLLKSFGQQLGGMGGQFGQ